MASHTQTLDDTVVALLSMGFDITDAQDAIQYGKLAVQDAVEWILSGKPGYAARGSAPPTLRLDGQSSGRPSLQPDTATPFISPLPVSHDAQSSSAGASAQLPSPAGSTAAPSSSDIDMEQQVVSRLHLTDARLAEKKNFEEKVRAEAEKTVRMEKLQAKRERDRVLKEIAEDRKMSKMMKTYNTAKPAANPSDDSKAPEKTTGSSEASASTSTSAPTQCSIQIRLPSGRQLRKKWDHATTLGQLWLNVLEEAEAETGGYSGFMQPFPRREFSAVEMNKTLEQLGLVPSGSLVLKKIDKAVEHMEQGAEPVQQDPPDPEAAPERDDAARPGPWQEVTPRQWGPGRSMDVQQPAEEQADNSDDEQEAGQSNWAGLNQSHFWGRGRQLEEEPQDEEMNGEGDDDNDMDDDWDDQMAGQNAGGAHQMAGQNAGAHGGGAHGGVMPMLQGFLGHRFGDWMGGALAQGAFEGVGQRLIPAGVPGADNHINRRMGELAAEAAQHRIAQPPPPQVGPSTPRPPAPTVQVRRLEDLCMAAAIESITCLSSRIHSLGRLPESLSEKILQHLVQQKLLDPKTLRLFHSCCLRKLILDTYNYATNDLLHAARLHPHLQVLSLHSCPLISDRGVECIAGLKNLKVLNLGICKQITNKCLKVIAGFKKLHTLTLEETAVTDSGITQYLALKPCLRNLNLNRTAVTDVIFQYLKDLEHLETLCLEETKVISLEGVRELRKLSGLNLGSTAITTDSLSQLVDNPTLRHLSLSNTDHIVGDTALLNLAGLKLKTLCMPDRHTVTNAGLAHIVSFPLVTLDLTNYIHVSDDGMQHIARISSLETLMLSNTKVMDAGLQHLSSLTKLKILHLDRTSVSDVGIRVVRAFRDLSELSLSATHVTNRFLKEGVLHACRGLSKLNLSRTHVGDRGLQHLTLPYLLLLNLDCTGVHAAVVDLIRFHCPALRSVTIANLTPVMEEDEEEEEEG